LEPLKQTLVPLLEAKAHPQWGHWFKLAGFLSEPHHRVLMRSVRDRLIYSKPGEALPVLEAGGAPLLSEGDFLEKADEVCRELLPLLLKEPGGLAYLIEYGHATAEFVRAAKQDSRDVLLDALSALHDPSVERNEEVDGLLGLWSSVAAMEPGGGAT
jgi:hypothetical protein